VSPGEVLAVEKNRNGQCYSLEHPWVNYNELLKLEQSFQPVAFCLQELISPNFYQFCNRQYSFVSKLLDVDNNNTLTGGSGILVRKDIPHSEIKLDSPPQAVACRISIPEPISACSVYLPPSTRRVLGTATTFCLLFPNCLHLSYSWETSTRTARCCMPASRTMMLTLSGRVLSLLPDTARQPRHTLLIYDEKRKTTINIYNDRKEKTNNKLAT
jgi:hypothetical protein